MFQMIRLSVVVVLVAGMGATGLAQDPGVKKTGKTIDNPLYQQWAKCKVGTFVTMKSTSKFGDYESVTEMTTTLKEVTAEKVVVSMQSASFVAGQKMEQPAMDQTFEAKMEEWVATQAGDKIDTKTEESKATLTVAGQELECKVLKTTMTMEGTTTVTTTWTSPKVPGEMVKSETEMQGGKMSSVVTAFEAK